VPAFCPRRKSETGWDWNTGWLGAGDERRKLDFGPRGCINIFPPWASIKNLWPVASLRLGAHHFDMCNGPLALMTAGLGDCSRRRQPNAKDKERVCVYASGLESRTAWQRHHLTETRGKIYVNGGKFPDWDWGTTEDEESMLCEYFTGMLCRQLPSCRYSDKTSRVTG